MDDVLMTNACVAKDGTGNYVIQSFVIHAATSMVSVKTEPACASQGGMESTALLKAVQEGKINTFFFISDVE